VELSIDLPRGDELNYVRLAVKGDRQAFQKLIQQYKLIMYRLGKTILKNDSDIGDAMQESILKAYKGIGNLKNEEVFKSWLLRILVNECNNILRKQKKTVPLDNMEEMGCDNSYDFDRHQVLSAVNTLEEDLRTTIILYYYDDLPVKDIVSVAGIPEGTVKSRLSRARKKLYELLKDR
jgi:RNA polymerase sigma-70 factor, ECF subfamily